MTGLMSPHGPTPSQVVFLQTDTQSTSPVISARPPRSCGNSLVLVLNFWWYIDDVGFSHHQLEPQHTSPNRNNPNPFAPGEILEVPFPEWTPADLGVSQNKNIPYFAEATNLYADENVNNDYKTKTCTLHYGAFNDVKVNAINSPVSGLANPQTPEVAIENVGQFDQSANVNVAISKMSYGAQWAVYDINGGRTWGRSTTGQRTGTGCAYIVYDYVVMPNDDWLATPGNVVAPGGAFSFWIKGYTYNDDSYEVYMSTVGNTPEDFYAGTMLFSGIAPSSYIFQTFDMSSYEGQTLYFGIRYTGNNAWYVWLDDVILPDGSPEGFEEQTSHLW